MTQENDENVQEYVYDIVVIGAGMAGLAAAEGLRKELPDLSLVVLEARDRVGGRIWTEEFNNSNSCFDLGATWIHGTKKNPIADLANQHGIKLMRDDSDEMWLTNEQGAEIADSLYDKKKRKFHKMMYQAKAYARKCKPPISVKEAIEHMNPEAFSDPLIMFLLKVEIEFDYGGPIDSIHGANFDEDEAFKGGDVIPYGGFKSILMTIANGLTIHNCVVVNTIRYNEKGADIETNRGVYRAKKVVCALPLGVLKSGKVQFQPQLSQPKLTAIRRIGLASVNKVVLLFGKVFWPKKTRGFGLVSYAINHKFTYFVNRFAFTGDMILEAYSVGTSAAEIDLQTDGETIQDALDSIYAIFQKEKDVSRESIQQSLQGALVTRWGHDEFSRGAYSFAAPETNEEDFSAFHGWEKGSLFFAGEHTSRSYRGTVHGAYMSGRHAARRIVKQFS